MDFINEQLLNHSVIVANILLLEVIYSFYLSNSLLVLASRLIVYFNLLSVGSVTPSVQAAADDPENGNANAGSSEAQGNRLGGGGGTPTPTPNYLGTGVRSSEPRDRVRRGDNARAPPHLQSRMNERAAAPAGDIEAAAFDDLTTEERLEERKSQIVSQIICSCILAVLSYCLVPIIRRGWAWYWVGPRSQWPDAPAGGKANAELRHHAAVSTAFVKDYITWYVLSVQERYYMDFMAADEPPPNLLLMLYRGNSNLPLFRVLLDVFILALQCLLLKMIFPNSHEPRVEVAPGLPPPSPAAVNSSLDADRCHRNGRGAVENGDSEPHQQPSLFGAATRHLFPQQQSREETEANGDAALQTRVGDTHSSRGSDKSGDGNDAGSTSPGPVANDSSTTKMTNRRKHHTSVNENGNTVGCEKLLSTANEKQGGTGGLRKEAGYLWEGSGAADVSIDFNGSRRFSGGSGGGVPAHGKRESMDEAGIDGDCIIVNEGAPGPVDGYFLSRPISALGKWFSVGGGLISGSSGVSTEQTSSAQRERRGKCNGYRDTKTRSNGAQRATFRQRPASAPAHDVNAPGEVIIVAVSERKSLRGLFRHVHHLVRAAFTSLVRGWSWELLTVEVPPEQGSTSVAGTLIMVAREPA